VKLFGQRGRKNHFLTPATFKREGGEAKGFPDGPNNQSLVAERNKKSPNMREGQPATGLLVEASCRQVENNKKGSVYRKQGKTVGIQTKRKEGRRKAAQGNLGGGIKGQPDGTYVVPWGEIKREKIGRP